MHAIRQKEIEPENILRDTFGQFSNRNRNPLQKPGIASTKFHITGFTTPRPLPVGGGSARSYQNADQPNLQPYTRIKSYFDTTSDADTTAHANPPDN